jgi:hypothetical protein
MNLQKKNIDPTIVPTVGMTFKDVVDACKFYKSWISTEEIQREDIQ